MILMMKINGYEYTKEEILAALKKKGYRIVIHTFHDEEHVHGSTFIKNHYTTECAVNHSELPTEKDQWHVIAKKEFETPIIKPPLI